MATGNWINPVIIGLCLGVGFGAAAGAWRGNSITGFEVGLFAGTAIGWVLGKLNAGGAASGNDENR